MNDNTATGPVETYSFVLEIKVGGVVDSSLPIDETQSKLEVELSDFYGEDGYKLVSFRPATDEEKGQYASLLADDLTTNGTVLQ